MAAYKGQKYSSIKKNCLKKGELFTDPEFPPNAKSLFFSKVDPEIEWKRPKVRLFHWQIEIVRLLNLSWMRRFLFATVDDMMLKGDLISLMFNSGCLSGELNN